MIDFNFKNKKITFHKLGLFAKKVNLDLKECLNEAFNQNALVDDNIDFLKRAGFKDIMPIAQYLCFKGFLAIK